MHNVWVEGKGGKMRTLVLLYRELRVRVHAHALVRHSAVWRSMQMFIILFLTFFGSSKERSLKLVAALCSPESDMRVSRMNAKDICSDIV